MRADLETANELIAKYYQPLSKSIKPKKMLINKEDLFDAIEMIAKGYAIIEVRTTGWLNKNQKKELVKIIKEI